MGRHSDSEHGRKLSEGFYSPSHDALRERIREAEGERSRQMEALAEASGIRDVALLEHLVLMGIRGETLAALTLYPLVAVAWADGRIDRRERQSVLDAADHCGLKPDSDSYQLLVDWLDRSPPDDLLLTAWKGVVSELCAEMDDEAKGRFREQIFARTRAVANASGGFLALD